MGEKTIQRIHVLPFALMNGIISGAMGLILGIIYALIFGAMIAAFPTTGVVNLGWLGVLFGVGAIIIMPIMGFAGGLITGVLVTILYNFLAPRIGGIRIRFKEESKVPLQS